MVDIYKYITGTILEMPAAVQEIFVWHGHKKVENAKENRHNNIASYTDSLYNPAFTPLFDAHDMVYCITLHEGC